MRTLTWPSPINSYSTPSAERRLDGAGAHSRRAARDRPPHPYRPAGGGHHWEGQPRHRTSAVQPSIPPDDPGHRRDSQGARLRYFLGLRAHLSHVQRVTDAAHSQDGRGGQCLPARSLDVARHRRAPVTWTSGTQRCLPDGPSQVTCAEKRGFRRLLAWTARLALA